MSVSRDATRQRGHVIEANGVNIYYPSHGLIGDRNEPVPSRSMLDFLRRRGVGER